MFDTKIRILIVDDMITMRKIVTKACRELGFEDIIEATDGQKAWEAIQASTPPVGLIISDLKMPNWSGLDLLKQVRGDERFKYLPFCLLTAESESHTVADAVRSGVDNYIIKPFNSRTLRAKLEAIYTRAANRGLQAAG